MPARKQSPSEPSIVDTGFVSDVDLWHRVSDCGVAVGSEWRHFNTGSHVVISDVVVREADLTICVVYYHHGANPVVHWTRPVNEFFERFRLAENPTC